MATIKIGNDSISKLMNGNSSCKAYLGDTLVYNPSSNNNDAEDD